MSSSLFNRNVYFSFGTPGTQGTEIRGLRVSFDIHKNDDPRSPNNGMIKIYGLSRDTVAQMQSGQDQKTILVYAGYGDQASLLFVGDIMKAKAEMEGPDRVTTIESGDGQVANSGARHTKSYGEGTSTSDIIGDLAGSMAGFLGQDKDEVSRNVASKAEDFLPSQVNEYPRGLAVSGQSSQTLERVCKANKLDWMIVDGQIEIVSRDGPLSEEAHFLSPDTGLIGSPTWTDDGRLEATALLRADIRPRSIVRIESRDFVGFALVRSVNHKGDSGYEKDFYSILQMTEL